MSNQDERDPLEVLAAEFMERLRQGQRPSIEDYAAQHPERAEEIRELFPTIAATERLKVRQGRSSDGRATLGPARLERLGDFRLIREIGRGGMGVVFEAEQESLGRRVAVKVLPRQVLLDDKHLERFEREARIAASLHHTNIVPVFGVGEQDGFHYYVMQLVEGVGLDAIIPLLAKLLNGQPSDKPQPERAMPATADSKDPLAEAAVRRLLGAGVEGGGDGRLGGAYWQSVARIGLQAAEALDYAHNQGVLHRDIKPANLLLDAQSSILLTDFGLAKAIESDDVSVSRDVVGTFRYMAPEQFRGEGNHQSDIYSLGLTLYELLALRPAYEETDQSRLIRRIREGPPPPSGAARLGAPRDLETIILKAVSHDAAQRYASAAAMAEDLRCFLEDRPIHARRVSAIERAVRWCRRNRSLAALTGTTLFLLVMVAVVASVGYVRTKRALQGEEQERLKAEASAGLAMEALDRMFERFSPSRVRTMPHLSADGSSGEVTALPTPPTVSKEAAALLEEMLPFYDRLAQQTGNDEKLRTGAAEANGRVGAIRQRLGQLDEAAKAYRRAIDLYQQLRAASPEDPALKLKLAQVQNALGRLYSSQRKTAEAREAHLAALALLESEAALPSASSALRFELARTCYFLGTEEHPLPGGDQRREAGPGRVPRELSESMSRAMETLKALTASAPANPDYQHLLALCYLEGAAGGEAKGEERKGGAERAIAILEGLVRDVPANPDYAYDLSEAYARIHLPQPPVPPEAQRAIEARLGKALVLLEKLVAQHPEVPDFAATEARVHDKLGAFQRQIGHWPEAEQQFRKAIAVQVSLVKEFPEAPYYGLWMATFRIALADALAHQDRATEAQADLQEAIGSLERQLEQRPEVPRPHNLLALGYSRLAMVLRQAGQREQADQATRKAEEERKAGRGAP